MDSDICESLSGHFTQNKHGRAGADLGEVTH